MSLELASPTFDGDVAPDRVPERYRLGAGVSTEGATSTRLPEVELDLVSPHLAHPAASRSAQRRQLRRARTAPVGAGGARSHARCGVQNACRHGAAPGTDRGRCDDHLTVPRGALEPRRNDQAPLDARVPAPSTRTGAPARPCDRGPVRFICMDDAAPALLDTWRRSPTCGAVQLQNMRSRWFRAPSPTATGRPCSTLSRGYHIPCTHPQSSGKRDNATRHHEEIETPQLAPLGYTPRDVPELGVKRSSRSGSQGPRVGRRRGQTGEARQRGGVNLLELRAIDPTKRRGPKSCYSSPRGQERRPVHLSCTASSPSRRDSTALDRARQWGRGYRGTSSQNRSCSQPGLLSGYRSRRRPRPTRPVRVHVLADPVAEYDKTGRSRRSSRGLTPGRPRPDPHPGPDTPRTSRSACTRRASTVTG